MALTPSTEYTALSGLGNILENWVFQLYYDDEGASDFKGFSFTDTTIDSVYYRGIVSNSPNIRNSIDLVNSKANTGNLELEIINIDYQGADISKLFFGGSNKYINRQVKVYSQLSENSALSDCLLIYTGRIIGTTHNDKTINFQIVAKRPFDFIEIPNTKTTEGKKWIPVSYGEFEVNPSSYYSTVPSNEDGNFEVSTLRFRSELTAKNLRPIPFNRRVGENMDFISGAGTVGEYGNYRQEYWDEGSGVFIPLIENVEDVVVAPISNDGAYILPVHNELKRAFAFRPISHTVVDDEIDFYNTGSYPVTNIYDGDQDTFAYIYILAGSYGDDQSHYLKYDFELPFPEGDMTEAHGYIVYEVLSSTITGSFNYIDLKMQGHILERLSSINNTQEKRIWRYDNWTENVVSIELEVKSDEDVGLVLRIYDIFVTAEMKSRDDQTKIIYAGGVGEIASYTGGASAVISRMHEAHRDLLAKFTDYDEASISGWDTDFENNRLFWKIRDWILEPTPLLEKLEQYQYEGGFIFTFENDSGRYIHIKDSYSSGDIDFTLEKNDINNVKISHTPFKSIVTQIELEYERHPTEGKYDKSVTLKNTTSRSNWILKGEANSKENIKQISLDSLVQGADEITDGNIKIQSGVALYDTADSNDIQTSEPNVGFVNYYNNIHGDIKLLVACNIVNPKYYGIECGDIVQFSEIGFEPFGYNFQSDDIVFMVTEVSRKVGVLGVKFREVFR